MFTFESTPSPPASETAKAKSEAAQKKNWIKGGIPDTTPKIKTELKTRVDQRPKVQDKENIKHKAKRSVSKDLLEKLDKFITDRNRIYPPFPLVPLLLL